MAGWMPIYDTMHGVRGEVNVMIKVELFSDYNKFRQSSCGVPVFCSEHRKLHAEYVKYAFDRPGRA